jgi:Homeodomain-like domain
VSLTNTERETLQAIIKKGKQPTKMKRAYVLLAADTATDQPAKTDQDIHDTYKVSIRTIERLRERFVSEGFEMALHGRPSEQVHYRKIDGEVEAHLIALTRSQVPDGHDKWTFRLLAEHMVALEYVESISPESVRQVLKKTC